MFRSYYWERSLGNQMCQPLREIFSTVLRLPTSFASDSWVPYFSRSGLLSISWVSDSSDSRLSDSPSPWLLLLPTSRVVEFLTPPTLGFPSPQLLRLLWLLTSWVVEFSIPPTLDFFWVLCVRIYPYQYELFPFWKKTWKSQEFKKSEAQASRVRGVIIIKEVEP